MKQHGEFHIVTMAWDRQLIEELMLPVAARSADRFSHIMHPGDVQADWPQHERHPNMHFLREQVRQPMPAADRSLLASLEREGIPTIHNMIMGDRIVSKVAYEDALGYATFLARRMIDLFARIKPDVIVGGFDASARRSCSGGRPVVEHPLARAELQRHAAGVGLLLRRSDAGGQGAGCSAAASAGTRGLRG